VVFGAPHVAGTRIPAEQIAAAVRAEGGEATGIAAAAEWFGLTAAAVHDALRFESEWPRRVT